MFKNTIYVSKSQCIRAKKSLIYPLIFYYITLTPTLTIYFRKIVFVTFYFTQMHWNAGANTLGFRNIH
jgi:hypothetical protein